MRVLYPAAHHDRFIHSLGTYHLGRRLFDLLCKQAKQEVKDELCQYRTTFLIACLMHDCGHAPFSHTCEKFYNYNREKGSASEKPVYQRLKEVYTEDFEVGGSFNPKEHEAFSAIILKQCYGAIIDEKYKNNVDLELAARMITGCTYPDETAPSTSIKNCLIGLLNGTAIDVDKLDYILRDTWASGVQNTTVDIDRLLAAARLHHGDDGRWTLCFSGAALSVLQTVLNVRNYLYEWIYGHHTVLYYSKLLERAVCALAEKLSPPKTELFWETVFSEKPFLSKQKLSKKYADFSIYLPTDGDVLYLLKHFQDGIKDAKEYLEHRPTRFALWKTSAEFRSLFEGHAMLSDPKKCDSIGKRIPMLFKENFSAVCKDKDDVIVTPGTFKPSRFDEGDISILMDNRPVPLTRLLRGLTPASAEYTFYVFVPVGARTEKSKMIDLIRKQKR